MDEIEHKTDFVGESPLRGRPSDHCTGRPQVVRRAAIERRVGSKDEIHYDVVCAGEVAIDEELVLLARSLALDALAHVDHVERRNVECFLCCPFNVDVDGRIDLAHVLEHRREGHVRRRQNLRVDPHTRGHDREAVVAAPGTAVLAALWTL
jgi:hypothetical protein